MSHTLNLKKFSFLVYGLGSTGLSVVKFLKKKNISNYYVWDDNIKLRKKFKNKFFSNLSEIFKKLIL